MRLQELATVLTEGGEVFKTADGRPKTQRIALRQIPGTLKWLAKISGLPTTNMTLGSVGKKTSSGDLDIAVDQNSITKDQLVDILSRWAHDQGLNPKDYVKKSGISVHFLTPIEGKTSQGYVQTDWMFDPDPEWLKFGMYSAGDSSSYTGADRNLLMSSIAKAQGLKYSWQKGLVNRQDESLISKDPNRIAQRLFGPNFDQDVFLSVEAMQEAIHNNSELKKQLTDLVNQLSSTTDSSGEPIKPGDLRKNQEEAARIKRLTGLG